MNAQPLYKTTMFFIISHDSLGEKSRTQPRNLRFFLTLGLSLSCPQQASRGLWDPRPLSHAWHLDTPLSGLFLSTHASLCSRWAQILFTKWQLTFSESVKMEVPGSLTGPEIAQPHFCLLLLVKASHQPALAGEEGKDTSPFTVRKGRSVPAGLGGPLPQGTNTRSLTHWSARSSGQPTQRGSTALWEWDPADFSLFHLSSSLHWPCFLGPPPKWQKSLPFLWVYCWENSNPDSRDWGDWSHKYKVLVFWVPVSSWKLWIGIGGR